MAERLSFIAGTGQLPREVIAAVRANGIEVQVLSLEKRRTLFGHPARPLDLRDPQGALEMIRTFRSTLIAAAGGLRLSDSQREAMLRFLGSQPATLGDTALSILSGYVEQHTGARIIGVHELAPHLLTPEGLIAGPAPAPALLESARFALDLARRSGQLDLGQGVVVAGRRTIALEDIAGTDALLRRVRTFRRFGLAGDGVSPLVLAKAAKPDQPHAIDLPAVGPRTIRIAKSAGIALIALEAGATIMVERERLVAAANKARLPVVGMAIDDR